MLQDRVLATPIVVPAPAPDEGVAEIVYSLVGRDVNHGEPRLDKTCGEDMFGNIPFGRNGILGFWRCAKLPQTKHRKPPIDSIGDY
ncbi:MAG: hypothetical protein VZQ98_15840 [Bacteroidales bacterium]|nr:hypothetical protein [Bacteroidales bacterium]